MEENRKEHRKKSEKNKGREQDNVLQRFIRRYRAVTIVFIALMAVLVVRLIVIIVFDGEKYAMAAMNQTIGRSVALDAKRGDILDRNGVQLATTARVYNLILGPFTILSVEKKYLEPTARLIEKYFDIPAEEIIAKVHDNPEKKYIILKKELKFSEVEGFKLESEKNGKNNCAYLEDNFKRIYNYDALAASILGYTQEGSGKCGLEYYYDDELSGTEGLKYSIVNADNSVDDITVDAVDGYTLLSSIDYNIQSICAKYIAETKAETQAETVAVIIQNPNTGEIYAMADSEEFDANNPGRLTQFYTEEQIKAMTEKQVSDELTRRQKNYCITQNFEPGSTFKPFTLSAALSNATTSMDDQFYCEGSKIVYDSEIHCHETLGHGSLDTMGAIAKSCNVALMDIAESLGAEEFCKMQERFGFGHYTGIDLPGEISCNGLIRKIDNMGPVDLATNAFGQNFETTMIQMSTGFCSIVNGGSYYKPYIVKNIVTSDGELIKTQDKTLMSTTVSTEISRKIKECLRAVVTDGTGKSAAVTGYKIAGKTGTAEIYEVNTEVNEEDEEETGYNKAEDTYIVSFLGFAPYDNPEVVCYVVVDRPNTGEDSSVAGRLFSKIMTEVLPYMNITPDGESTDIAMWGDEYWDQFYEDGTEEPGLQPEEDGQEEPEQDMQPEEDAGNEEEY